MNLTERGNYMIAILISLAFHLLLLILFIPGYLASKSTSLETYPVGLVEIAPGSPDDSNGMMGSLPNDTVQAPPNASKNPEDKPQVKGKIVTKPNVDSKSPPESAIILPKKDGSATADDSSKKIALKGPQVGDNQGTGGNGTVNTGKPQGFGTGEGMVTVLGPLPPYPKNAINEGKEGEVALRILVKADGSLEQVNLTKSSGDLRLDKAAASTIQRSWKFKPVTKDYYIDLVFSFNIQTEVTVKFINSESRF
jgi:TonB family protein